MGGKRRVGPNAVPGAIVGVQGFAEAYAAGRLDEVEALRRIEAELAALPAGERQGALDESVIAYSTARVGWRVAAYGLLIRAGAVAPKPPTPGAPRSPFVVGTDT
jgi:hypothetical protein